MNQHLSERIAGTLFYGFLIYIAVYLAIAFVDGDESTALPITIFVTGAVMLHLLDRGAKAVKPPVETSASSWPTQKPPTFK